MPAPSLFDREERYDREAFTTAHLRTQRREMSMVERLECFLTLTGNLCQS